jgi:hypothetical protein
VAPDIFARTSFCSAGPGPSRRVLSERLGRKRSKLHCTPTPTPGRGHPLLFTRAVTRTKMDFCGHDKKRTRQIDDLVRAPRLKAFLESSGQRHRTFDIFSKHGFSSKKKVVRRSDRPCSFSSTKVTLAKNFLMTKNFCWSRELHGGGVRNFFFGWGI